MQTVNLALPQKLEFHQRAGRSLGMGCSLAMVPWEKQCLSQEELVYAEEFSFVRPCRKLVLDNCGKDIQLMARKAGPKE